MTITHKTIFIDGDLSNVDQMTEEDHFDMLFDLAKSKHFKTEISDDQITNYVKYLEHFKDNLKMSHYVIDVFLMTDCPDPDSMKTGASYRILNSYIDGERIHNIYVKSLAFRDEGTERERQRLVDLNASQRQEDLKVLMDTNSDESEHFKKYH